MAPPQLVYGTSEIGTRDLAAEEDSLAILEYVYSQGIRIIDTASLYPPGNPGRAEQIISRFIATHPDVQIWTKTLVSISGQGRGDLKHENILKSAKTSHERLGQNIEVYFPHAPDVLTPVSESVTAFKELQDRGLCKHIGLSNYSVEQARGFYEACEEVGVASPSFTMWMYNPLSRGIEKDFIPFYRSKGTAIAAYSPLAGGFLTGKVTDGKATRSRYDPKWFPEAKIYYPDVFDKHIFHQAFRMLRDEAEKHGIDVANASLRWMLYHSALTEGDAIILGATKLTQIQQTLDGLRQNGGPLPQPMVNVFEQAWSLVKDEQITRHGLDG